MLGYGPGARPRAGCSDTGRMFNHGPNARARGGGHVAGQRFVNVPDPDYPVSTPVPNGGACGSMAPAAERRCMWLDGPARSEPGNRTPRSSTFTYGNRGWSQDVLVGGRD